ncbi:hypothetical protein K438DRAFT_1937343 [Mycena galopus ATCC 62051]|nr:hypothetical protein K438DRAFT_1937343 [Mycena galopus ATCC 62051]
MGTLDQADSDTVPCFLGCVESRICNSNTDAAAAQCLHIAAITTAVANGDLSKHTFPPTPRTCIPFALFPSCSLSLASQVSANGEIIDLKNTVNGIVLRLHTLAGEVTRVTLDGDGVGPGVPNRRCRDFVRRVGGTAWAALGSGVRETQGTHSGGACGGRGRTDTGVCRKRLGQRQRQGGTRASLRTSGRRWTLCAEHGGTVGRTCAACARDVAWCIPVSRPWDADAARNKHGLDLGCERGRGWGGLGLGRRGAQGLGYAPYAYGLGLAMSGRGVGYSCFIPFPHSRYYSSGQSYPTLLVLTLLGKGGRTERGGSYPTLLVLTLLGKGGRTERGDDAVRRLTAKGREGRKGCRSTRAQWGGDEGRGRTSSGPREGERNRGGAGVGTDVVREEGRLSEGEEQGRSRGGAKKGNGDGVREGRGFGGEAENVKTLVEWGGCAVVFLVHIAKIAPGPGWKQSRRDLSPTQGEAQYTVI